MDLFQTGRKFGLDSELGIKSTVALTEYYLFLNMADKYEWNDRVRALKDRIKENCLQNADQTVLREIVKINNKLRVNVADLDAIAKRAPKSNPVTTFGRNRYHLVGLSRFLCPYSC